MTGMPASYQLQTFTGYLSHGWLPSVFVRDGNEWPQNESILPIDAEVKSGDYFVTLATTLDQLSKEASDWHVKTRLEDTVSDLIYLQDNYTITKNNPSK